MIQRVNGSLAVSRALGDFDYKSVPGVDPCDQLVSPEPDVYVVERDKIPSAVSSPKPARSSIAGSDEVFLSQEASSSSAASSNKDSSSEGGSPPKEGKSSPESAELSQGFKNDYLKGIRNAV
uniref:PPM-type phosphatase domain-containing protein n=1 Tax=Romanomermis culicivorax TaxID=13658 RepID=A0A915IGP0_ROMCU